MLKLFVPPTILLRIEGMYLYSAVFAQKRLSCMLLGEKMCKFIWKKINFNIRYVNAALKLATS